jgi:hypothetical protein
MNLVQVQEHLKGMPTPVLMGYANGQNPQVPPYIALGELNRRKQMEQQPAQPPQGSVKDQIEQSLSQPQGLPGMAAQGVPVPQAPQPQGIPSQMPQQLAGSAPQQAPTRMAAGGLASVPMRRDMFNYAPGGIVAFANEENDQVVKDPVYDETTQARGAEIIEQIRAAANEKPVEKTGKTASVSEMANRILMDQMAGKTNVEAPEDPEIARARLFEKYPILRTAPGAQAEKLAMALEAKDKAQTERFKASEGRMGLAGLSNALIAAGEATRGQKGSGIGSAFGGFGKAYNAETAAAEERATKQEGLERGRMVDVSKIRSDIEGLQRAQAEGRVSEAMKYKEALNKQVADVEKTKGTAAAAALKNEIDLAQLAATKAHYAATQAKPSSFAEQWEAMQKNPELYALFQGEKKSGELTIEDALKRVQGNELFKYKKLPDQITEAQKLVDEDKIQRAAARATAAKNDKTPPKPNPSGAPEGYDPSKVRLKGG